jgi:glycosyltransferase involved in cell wall biosynthesis
MQLLLISRCPPYPLYLGDRLILFHLARELSQRGHTLDLLAFNDRSDIPDNPSAYADYFRHVEVIPAPGRGLTRYLRRLFFPAARFPHRAEDSGSPAMWNAVQRRLEHHEYDVVHLFGGIQVYEYKHLLESLPGLITPYESYSLYLRRALENTRSLHSTPLPQRFSLTVQYPPARAFERFMFTPYERTVVVSEPDAQELRTINPTLNVSVIPNGVDLAPLEPHHAEREAALLLFTGNYEYAPNVDAALYLAKVVLPQVRAQIPEAKLYLVGNAPPKALVSLAGEHVIVTGRVPEIQAYLKRATVFVSPLRMGAGIKNKVLEALASGCPVVATPLSADGITVENGRDALIAELDTLPETVVRLLRDTDLQRSLAEHGRALVAARYTWGRVADMYEALYEAIRQQHSASQ